MHICRSHTAPAQQEHICGEIYVQNFLKKHNVRER